MWLFQADLSGLRVAVLGAGKIGSVFIERLSGHVREVLATGRRPETLARAEELGATPLRDNARAASLADVVIVSVKPHHLPEVLREIHGHVSGKIVVSIVAGVRRATLQEVLEGATVFRAMPNINARVGGSATAVADSGDYDPKSRAVVEALFSRLGSVYWVPEEWLDPWTGLVGSGPAYIAEIIDGLVLGAVSMGLPREVVYRAVLDTLKATAELLANSDRHPAVLRDEVTTPAGTTIHGLKKFEEMGVKAALMSVVEAASVRGKELGDAIDAEVRRRLGLARRER